MINSKTEELNEQVIDLNCLLQSMLEGAIIQDSSGKIIQFNQSALDILGLTKDQLKERNSINSIDLDLNNWNKIFPGKNHFGMKTFKTGLAELNIPLQVFRPSGEVCWISLNSVPIFNDPKKAQPTHIICTFSDNTQMRSLNNELRQIQLLYNNTHDLMIITNQEGYFKKINPRFTTVLGHELNEILSLKFLNLVHPEDLAETELEMIKLTKNNESIHFINRYKAKNNNFRVFDWIVIPDTETKLFYYTARDITEYRAEELNIIHSSKIYSIGELTSGLTYSLNAQLSIISGNVDFLQSEIEKGHYKTEVLKEKINGIADSVKNITKTTKSLNLFAYNAENEKNDNVSLKRILDIVLNLSIEQFRIHGIRLEVENKDNIYIQSKESQITQVLITLLNYGYNAVHLQRDGWVELKTMSLNDDYARIIIRNSASIKQTNDTKILNNSQKIIEQNQGHFFVDKLSPYMTFMIDLPKANINTI